MIRYKKKVLEERYADRDQCRRRKNKTIRDALQEQGLSLDYVCGGIGRCGKCAVRVISGHVSVTGADRAFFSKEALEQGWRLACQMQVTDDIEIEVAEDLVCQKEAGIQVAGLYPQDEKTHRGGANKGCLWHCY